MQLIVLVNVVSRFIQYCASTLRSLQEEFEINIFYDDKYAFSGNESNLFQVEK